MTTTDSDTTEKTEIERLYWGLAVQAQRSIPESLRGPRKKVIVLSGPTACGKSAFAMKLAKLVGGEIISADSMQVYRGMDIGTAKPTLAEQAAVPHHLIDIRDLNEHFNVVDFYYEARRCCQSLLAMGKVPIVVGGSGFYIHALIYGPPSGPPPEPELRKKLEDEAASIGVGTLYERLREQDPLYASTVTKSDKQKIIRALEIISLTGKKVSRHAWKHRVTPVTYDFQCWFLHRPREQLYQRIEKRCEKMLSEGLIKEIENLEEKGLRQNPSAAQAIGYRQVLEYLNSQRTEVDNKSLLESFKKASRQYAKRQLTWFRREPSFKWLDLEIDEEIALDTIFQHYIAENY